LAPLALLLTTAARHDDPTWAAIAHHATLRFSHVALVSVAILLVTGIVNAWILVGSFRGLIGTDYGRLLMVKIGLFAAMLAIAVINRLLLTPRLSRLSDDGPRRDAQHRLKRNIIVEIALGLAIFAVVGVLGILHPAIHLLPP
jgi:putative copper resistance protein D